MEKHVLYNGEVEMDYDDVDHKYYYNSLDLPSSTTITGILDKPALRYWYVNQALDRLRSKIIPGRSYDEVQIENIFSKAKYSGNDARDKAASIGRLVHTWIEGYVKEQIINGIANVPPFPHHTGAVKSIESFLRWERENDPSYIFSERRMISQKHLFAGTLDIAALVDGKPYVIDIKTGKAVYPEYWLQTASYALMLSEEQPDGWSYSLEDTGRIILLIPQATGKLSVRKPKSDILADADTFVNLRNVYRWKESK